MREHRERVMVKTWWRTRRSPKYNYKQMLQERS